MRKLLLSTIAVFFLLTAFAVPKRYKLLRNATSWSVASNWSPTGVPGDGDTAMIPENIQLTLSSDLTYNNLFIDLYGTLVLSGSNMKMLLQSASTVKIHTSGTLIGSKASQQLVFGNTLVFKGDEPVLNGPLMATSTSLGFVPFIENSVLPVKFISFTVVHNTTGYLIKWTAAEEKDAAAYHVQRSTDGRNWTTIATLTAIGNSTNSYTYTDKSGAAGTVYYRIKESDRDGVFTYTSVRTLKSGDAEPVITAVQNKVTVSFTQSLKGKIMVEVIGLSGTTAATQVVIDPSGTLQLATSGLRGIYIVRVSNSQGLNLAKQILL